MNNEAQKPERDEQASAGPEGQQAQPAGESTLAPHTVDTNPGVFSAAGSFPERIAQYEMQGVLGEGGMGVVFKAHDSRLRRDVAFKTIRPSTRKQGFIDRLQREARLLAQLDHPHIVRILDFGEEEDRAWLAMELLSGETLADQMRSEELSDPRAVAERALQIARAVGYCHTAGIVHRDLKPANVLVDDEGRLKVTDFGLGRSTSNESRLTRSGDVVGTLQYMAPEQATGAVQQIKPGSDVYALGVILYELLTGEPPFAEEDPLRTITRILAEEPASPRKLREDIPVELETICLKCLEKKAASRYVDANELAEDLQRFLSNSAIEARPVSFAQRMVRTARRHPVISAVVTLTLAFLIFGLFALGMHNRRLQAELERSQRLVNRSREFSNWLLYDFAEALERPQGLTAVRAEMLDHIVTHLNDTLADAETDEQLRFDLAKAYVRVSHLQGNPETFNLGRPDDALRSLDKAESLLNAFTGNRALAARQLFMKAMVAEARGDIAASTDHRDRAESHYRAGLARLTELEHRKPFAAAEPEEKTRRATLRASLLVGIAELARMDQQFDKAIKLADGAAASVAREGVTADPLSVVRIPLTKAQALSDSGRHDEAVPVWESAEANIRRHGKSSALTLGADQPLVVALLGKAGSLTHLRKYAEAEAAYDEALQLNAKLLDRDRGNQMLRRERAIVLRDKVTLHLAQGKVAAADRELLDEAVQMFTELIAQDASNHLAREDLVSMYGFVGAYHIMSFAPDLAEDAFQQGKKLALQLIEDQHGTPGVRQALAEAERGLGNADSLRMSAAAAELIKAEEAGKPAPDVDPGMHTQLAIDHFVESQKLFKVLEEKYGLTASQRASAAAADELLKMHRDLLQSKQQ